MQSIARSHDNDRAAYRPRCIIPKAKPGGENTRAIRRRCSPCLHPEVEPVLAAVVGCCW